MGTDPEARWLARALELARAGDTMSGAVLVSGGETGDPSAHAELSVPQGALPCAEVLRRAPTPVRVRVALLHEVCLEHCRALASPS